MGARGELGVGKRSEGKRRKAFTARLTETPPQLARSLDNLELSKSTLKIVYSATVTDISCGPCRHKRNVT